MQIELLSIFSFFWPPRETKQGIEALRLGSVGWYKLKTISGKASWRRHPSSFFSFLLLSMRIFFFNFFWVMMMIQGRGNIFPWLLWYSFSMLLYLVCLFSRHTALSGQIPWGFLKTTCAWVCLHGAWTGSLREVKGIWKNHSGCTLTSSRCWHWRHQVETFTYGMPQPPVDKTVLVSTFWA